MSADHRLGQANLIGDSQLLAHDSLGLAEVANLNAAHGHSSSAPVAISEQ
jgi:hypothetical protein